MIDLQFTAIAFTLSMQVFQCADLSREQIVHLQVLIELRNFLNPFKFNLSSFLRCYVASSKLNLEV